VSKVSRRIAALGAVLFAAVGLAACGGVPSDAVVQIDGKPLKKATFAHWLAVAATANGAPAGGKPVLPEPPKYKACIAHLRETTPKPAKGQPAPTEAQFKSQCEQQYKSLLQEVMGFLISSEWVLGEANSLGVKVNDKEVKKRFNQIREQQFPKAAEFEKFLTSSGQTVSDLLLRVKLNLLSQKLQQKIVNSKSKPTQAQIAKYYNEHKERFGTPEKRAVNIILTKDEAAAKKAKQEIESGKSFASVAKRVSTDPLTKASGGKLPVVVKGEEEKTLDAAIFSAKKAALSGPVKTPFGYYVYEVTGITPGNQQSLAQAQSSVKAQLVASQQQTALSSFIKNFKKKWTAKTDCASGYVVMDCKQYKAPKTGTRTGTGTGTSTTPAP
jgi:foldase protein PrsA